MELSNAIELIRGGVGTANAGPQTWADLGAGSGLFTQALASLLPPASRIYAVDQDGEALDSIAWGYADKTLIRIKANINDLPELPPLDGALLGNVLHYLTDQAGFLKRVGGQLSYRGAIVVIEYDTDIGNQWVPYPMSLEHLKDLATHLHFDMTMLGKARSRFNTGALYCALLRPRK